MRVLAIDIGEKRCGVAISDAEQRVATPLDTLDLSEVINNSGKFARMLEDWEPELILCGLPMSLSGEEGKQAHRIRTIAGQISRACNIPCDFTDERLSSKQAKDALSEMGYHGKETKGKVDMLAATFFLQAWLDQNR